MLQLAFLQVAVYLFVGQLQLARCQSFAYISPLTNKVVAELDTAGHLKFYSLYQPENDIPEQRAVLDELYAATAGENWTPAVYQQAALLDEALAFQEAYANVTETIYVDFTTFVTLFLLKVPFGTPGFSYCRFWGVECCLTATESSIPGCTMGLQSIAVLEFTGAGLVGSLPKSVYESLPDLTLLFMASNPELTGAIEDVPASVRSTMQLIQMSGTLLQTPCAFPSASGSKVTYYASCTSNMFAWNTEQQTAASNKEGMVCPGLLINRPSTVTNQSAAFYNNIVLSDPLVYSYQGCNCTAPLVAHYSNDSGLFEMDCVAQHKSSWLWYLLGPIIGVGVLALAVLWLVLNYRARLLQAWETMRTTALKRRNAPGTLMARQGKGMDLFHSGVTLVKSTVEGRAALMADSRAAMIHALVMHDHALRTLLPKYCGYEVTTEDGSFTVAFHDPIDAISWALHAQLNLLEAPWAAELLEQPQARIGSCASGRTIFRGLRARMAINTGVPAEIIIHSLTKRVEYRGEFVELTDSLSMLPAGGQVLLSDSTFQRIGGRLHEVKLPTLSLPIKGGSGANQSSRRPTRTSLEMPSRAGSSTTVPTMKGKTQGASRKGLSALRVDGGLSDRADSVRSTDQLMASDTPQAMSLEAPQTAPKRKGPRAGLSRRFSLTMGLRRPRPGKQMSLTTSEQQQFPADDDDMSSRSTAADTAAAAEAALASMLRTSCTIIDMGSYLLSERGSRPYNADDAALPPIAGEHVRQILPEALVERAGLFPPFDPTRQVAPSFFDAPGAQESMPSSANSGLITATSVASISLTNTRRFSADLPNITFAFASEVAYKEVVRLDKQQGLIALGRFKSCVRTSLLLCGGYECQEKEGTFMIAFPHPRAAVEWALTLQLALLRLPWGEGLLGLAPTQEDRSSVTGQLLFRGLSAKVGIFHGPIVKLCPHSTTGRADYFGTPVNRAARLWAGCNAGQILIEQSAIAAVGAEWAGASAEGLPGPAPAASSSSIAARNHALLTKRMQTEQSSTLFPAASSSGKPPGLKRTVTIQPNAFSKSHSSLGDAALPAVFVSDETGSLSPVTPKGPRSARRSADMSAQFRAVKDADTVPLSPLYRDSRTESRGWDAKIEAKAAGVGREGVGRDGSGLGKQELAPGAMGDNQQQRASEDGISKLHTKSFTDAHRVGTQMELGSAALKLPVTSMKAEVYHVGQFSFKGIQEATDVCQVLPASLSERRDTYKDVSANTNGKAVCLEQNDSFYFAAQLQLPNVFHLPLAAEPPLYINVVRAEFQSFTGMRSGNPRVTRAS